MDIDHIEHPTDTAGKKRRRNILFALPLAIQTVLTLVYFWPGIYPATLFLLFEVVTFIYTVILFVVGVICATSMSLESLCGRIKRDNKTELQWVRDFFKTVKKYLPAYNRSFAGAGRKLAAIASSGLYIFALAINWFVGNAITTLFSVCMIAFGMWMVKECNRMIEEARLKEEAKKAKKRQVSDEVAGISRVYGGEV